MKKFLTGLMLAGCSLGVAAETQINLAAGQQLTGTAVKKLVLEEGQTANNFWFGVSPSQVGSSAGLNLTGCALSTHLSLNQGQLAVATEQLRCITEEGDIYTQPKFKARFTSSSNQVCTANSGGCTQVTLYENSSYAFELTEATSLEAELNVMHEVNRARLITD